MKQSGNTFHSISVTKESKLSSLTASALLASLLRRWYASSRQFYPTAPLLSHDHSLSSQALLNCLALVAPSHDA